MRRIIIFAALITLITGCSWENEETLFPETESCDTTNVSFAADITPILTNNCFACHSNANAPDFAYGISLEDHQDVAANATLILGAIKHQDGFPQMPQNMDQLDACSIGVIEAWVNAGTPDN